MIVIQIAMRPMHNQIATHARYLSMDLDQIEAFVSVATLGGFTRASQQLHRTQPAISRRVSLLEKSLGVDLFERAGREVHLTPAGTAFLPYAESALATLRDGASVIRTGSVPLRVALVGTLADQHLGQTLELFKQSSRDAQVSLRTATSREVSQLVLRGEADVGFRYFLDRHPGLTAAHVGKDTLALVCAANHPFAGRTMTDAEPLAQESWISFPTDTQQPDSFGQLLVRALIGVGIPEPRLTIVDSLTAQKRLVQAGYGLAMLPPGSCEDELAIGSLAQIRVRGLSAEQPVYAIQRRGAATSASDSFIRIFRTSALKRRRRRQQRARLRRQPTG